MQVFNAEAFQLVHASKYPAPILSMAISIDNGAMAVGMSDGVVAVRRKHQEPIIQGSAESSTRFVRRVKCQIFVAVFGGYPKYPSKFALYAGMHLV